MRITTTLTASALASAAAAALLAALAVTPASARPDPATTPESAQVAVRAFDDRCTLERIGTQFIRCDDLTGAGVPAPSFIPERH